MLKHIKRFCQQWSSYPFLMPFIIIMVSGGSVLVILLSLWVMAWAFYAVTMGLDWPDLSFFMRWARGQ